MRRFPLWAGAALTIALAAGADAARKQDETKPARTPRQVATEIDRSIAAKLKEEKIGPSPRADDAEFLRRVSLDITGKIPSAEKAKAFLDSKDAKKRGKLIDDLLASKDYGEHFGTIWRDQMIRPDANQIRPPDTAPLAKWLAEEFNKNTGWDKIVHEILTVEGPKPAGVFYLLNGDTRNNPQANVIAASVAQLFMGVQLACAECHQHPFQENLKQNDFWGVAAFFGKVNGVGAVNKKLAGPNITEKVAIKRGKRNDSPRMKGASIVIPDTAFKGIGRAVKAKLPGDAEPKLDTSEPFRPTFAKWLKAKDNPYFAVNAVNRLWAHFMGKGFVNPVADMHEANPASHPDLLKKLAKEFAENGFDQKHLIRCICNSQTYQRTSRPVASNKVEEHFFARQEVKVIAPSVLYDTLCQALGTSNLETPLKQAGGKKGAAKKKAAKKKVPKKYPGYTAKQAFVDFYTTKEVGGDATEYSHGIPQALRLMNEELFNTGGKTVEAAIKKGGGTATIVESLYLSVLSRRPTAEEAKETTAYVAKQSDSKAGYRGVFWALLNSAEFTINR